MTGDIHVFRYAANRGSIFGVNAILSKLFITIIALGSVTCGVAVAAADNPVDANNLARKVYAASHNEGLKNAICRRNGRSAAMLVNRVPTAMRAGRKPLVQTFDIFINNQPSDAEIDTVQMAILTSGKAKGTGVLVTRYTDPARSAILSMWLPALRKMRQINEPSHDDVWFGTNLTYGELVLRKPEDETHEYLGEDHLQGCLGTMAFEDDEKNRFTEQLPGEQCEHKGKDVYLLKSTTKFANWWYDYHISEIDKESFALYRTVYYKGDEKVKSIFIDWQSLDRPDPRITYPRFIYAVMHTDGKDSMVFVPRSTIELDVDLPDGFWTEKTMETYGLD